MHVVLCNNWYPPQTGFGGVGMYDWYLSRALAKLDHHVTVIAARWSPDVPEIETLDGVVVRRLLIGDRRWTRTVPGVRRYARSIVQYLYSRRVAAVLAEMSTNRTRPKINLVEFADVGAEGFSYLRRQSREPVVVRCHTPTAVLRRHYLPEEMPYGTRWTESLERFCIRNADGLTAPSRDMARVVSEICEVAVERIAVVPNLIDVDAFVGDREPRIRQGNEVVILHVGRLERVKGIEVLVEAIPRVLERFPSSRFVFVGDDLPVAGGESWQLRMQQRLSALGSAGHVRFLGALPQKELLAQYRAADIAVVPTLNYESFSYTCGEAMAAGLPVVASRIGGIPETVEDGRSGILIEPGSVSELVSSIAKLVENSETRHRMGIAGRERAKERFDSPVVAERMVDFYQNVVGPSHSPR
ncbi:MAG: glycosyltransferase family 4 protein [Vicinamibacteria bacterium]